MNKSNAVCPFQYPFNLGLINVGAPACGMNAAMRAFVRLALTKGFGVLGIRYGFEGLLNDNVRSTSKSSSMNCVC